MVKRAVLTRDDRAGDRELRRPFDDEAHVVGIAEQHRQGFLADDIDGLSFAAHIEVEAPTGCVEDLGPAVARETISTDASHRPAMDSAGWTVSTAVVSVPDSGDILGRPVAAVGPESSDTGGARTSPRLPCPAVRARQSATGAGSSTAAAPVSAQRLRRRRLPGQQPVGGCDYRRWRPAKRSRDLAWAPGAVCGARTRRAEVAVNAVSP